MTKRFSAEAREEWRVHWPLVFASLVGVSMMSIAMGSLGAFVAPLEQEFGWSRAQISAGIPLFSVIGLVVTPLLGAAVDRWGPRRFGVPGVLLTGVSVALFGTVTASIIYWLVLWAVYSIISQIPRQMVFSAAVSSEFKASRGIALGTVMAGAGLGAIVTPVLAGYLIDAYGWRLAYVIMGLGWGGLAWVLCYFFFYGRTDRLRSSSAGDKGAAPILTGASARDGLTSITFAKLGCAALLSYTMTVALLVHLIPLLSSEGIPRADAILIAGLSGVATIFGQLSSGAIADRVPGNFLSAVAACLPPLAYAILLIKPDVMLFVVIAVILIGISAGAVNNMLPYLTTRYFGLRSFGKIYGIVACMIGIGAGLGPVLAGYIYDRTHSYELLLITGIPLAIMCALLFLSLGRYPDEPANLSQALA